MGALFAKLEKREPKRMKYRIALFSDEEDVPKESLDLYESQGWNYVCSYKRFGGNTLISYKNFFLFSAPEVENTAELSLNTEDQIYELEKLKKCLFRESVCSFIFIILYLILLYLLVHNKDSIYLALIDIIFHMYTFIVFSFVYSAIRSLLGYKYVNKTISSFSKEEKENHYLYWKDKSYVLQRVFLIIATIFTIYLISQIITIRNHNFKDETYNLPIVTLYDIEGTKDLVRTGSILYTAVNEANYYNCNFNIFATTYTTSESVAKDETDIYMYTSTYKVTLPFMVDNLVLALEKENNYGEQSTKIEKKGFDYLSIYTNIYRSVISNNTNHHEIFASRGKNIIYVRYSGKTDLEKILKVISDKFSMLESS